MINNLHRPLNDADFPQKKAHKDLMSYMVFFGVSRNEAFLRFNPHFLNPKTQKLNDTGVLECRNFFSLKINQDYIEAYKRTLEKRFKGLELGGNNTIDDNRKDKALKALLNRAMSLVEEDSELDPDTLKTLTEIFKKTGLLKDDVEQEMRPIRVLPARCKSECRYRLFCETAKADGAIIDDCDYCKARAFAEKHGFKYNPCTVLDMPENVTAEIENRNNVSLIDIINGKINN